MRDEANSRRSAAREKCQLGSVKCRRRILAERKLVWEFSNALCPLDKFNDNGTLGLDCTWQEFGAGGTATQYWTCSRAGFISERLREAT